MQKINKIKTPILFKLVLLLLLCHLVSSAEIGTKLLEKKRLQIKIQMEGTLKDTLYLYWGESNYISLDDLRDNIKKSARNKRSNMFDFSIDDKSEAGGYFYIEKNNLSNKTIYTTINLSPIFYFESGDVITMKIESVGENKNITFSGKNAIKYNIQNKLDSVYMNGDIDFSPVKSDSMQIWRFEDPLKNRVNNAYVFLNQNKELLDCSLYNILLCNLTFRNSTDRYSIIQNFLVKQKRKGRNVDSAELNKLTNMYDSLSNVIAPSNATANSSLFVKHLLYRFRLKNEFWPTMQGKLGLPELLNNFHKQSFKEYVMLVYLANFRLSDEEINFYRNYIKNTPLFREKLGIRQNLISKLKSEDFSFQDDQGQIKKISDYKGKVIVCDFWFTGCGVCVYYNKNILEKVEKLLNNNNDSVVYLSISTDKDKDFWLKSVGSKNYTSSKSVNLYTMGMGLDHAIVMKYKITTFPFVIVIDKDGYVDGVNLEEYQSVEAFSAIISRLLKQKDKMY